VNGETDLADSITDLANDIKARRKEREAAVEDRAAHDAAEAIVSARLELKAAEAEVKRTTATAKDTQGEADKYAAKIKKADNKRANLEQNPQGVFARDEVKVVKLEGEILNLRRLYDYHNQRCMEAAGPYAGAIDRERKAREALAKAEAVLQ